MTLSRLTDDPSKGEFHSMLRKARAQSLSPDARRRIEEALHAAPLAVPATPPGRGLLVKGALGLSALAVVAGAFVWGSRPASPIAAPTPNAPTAAPRIAESPVAIPSEEPTLSVHDLPEAPAKVAASAPPPIDDGLGREAALLRAVREQIAAGRGEDALRTLDHYDQQFRAKGAMGEEAGVERVEALLLVGDSTRAHALASKLLADKPDGPFARKLRSLLANDNPDR